MSELTDLARYQVEQANAEFYRAFAACDLERMEALWDTGDHVRCVHPGWPLLVGWLAVRRSWAQIFSGADNMPISFARAQVRAAGELGWVSCIERIESRARGGTMINEVVATNVFERDADGRWRMVEHHASPILAGARDRGPDDDDDERDDLN